MIHHVPSHSAYGHGCRCEACRLLHSQYTKARRAKALAAGTLTHGRVSTYDAGCRCDDCKAEKSRAHRSYWRRSGRAKWPAIGSDGAA